ncbi:MAG: hypothetical protein MUC50_06130 [Myxococcota bacterium]|jgi:type IV pilus assembly protein PilB|nr:hypothetical protein [Myxococcota bacterium]
MFENRRPLGETLIEAGVLTADQLQTALSLQEKRQIRLGTILLQEGIVTEPQLVQALSRQLSIPWVSLWHIDIPDHLLRLVPVSLAEEFFLIPIYVRSSPSGDKTLYVAMNDPTDEAALRFVSAGAGMPVRPMIAGPSDIAAAIRAYYFGEENSLPPPDPARESTASPPPARPAPPLTKAVPPPAPPPPAKAQPKQDQPVEELAPEEMEEWQSGVHKLSDIEAELEKKRAGIEAQKRAVRNAATGWTLSSPQSPDHEITRPGAPGLGTTARTSGAPSDPMRVDHQRQVERHMFGIGHGSGKPSSISLTLLDGTTISFGGARKVQGGGPSLGKEELLKALRAAAEGTLEENTLPTIKWEDHLAALLEILFRKHLINHDEYLEALWKK